MYVYIKDRKAFLITPIVGGTEIATDNTCKTFKSLQKFTENVMEELNFMEDFLRLLGKDYNDILNEIVHLKELYTSARNTGIFDNVSRYGYRRASPILSTTNNMLLDVSIDRDDFTKVTNHTFSARNRYLGKELRNQIGKIESVKNNIPSIEFFRNNLPNIKITETETAVLQICKETWNKCNFPTDKWQDFSGALEDRIALIKKYGEGAEFDKVQLTGALEDTWGITFVDEINFNSLAKDIFSTIADQARRDDKTSLLTQFFLATVNIYIKDLNGSCKNFGKIFDMNNDLSNQLAIVVKESLEEGFNTEEKIINFLVEKLIINALSPEQITAVKKIFTRQYCMIRKSTQFDEFIVLPKNTNSPWFEYDGSFCVEFSYLCSNIPGLEDIQKDLHRDKYIELKRDSHNSLQFMNPASNFDLDNIKINLDNNNMQNFISLSESDYNQAHLFIEKIAKNIEFSNINDKEAIQSLFFFAIDAANENLLSKTIKNGADLNQSKSDGNAALHLAAKNGHIEIVKTLLNAGANPNTKNHDGTVALHWAAKIGNIEIVKALLEANADPNIADKFGYTALHFATAFKNLEIVKALLSAKANPNITNEEGDVALHWAASMGHIETVQALLKANANPDTRNQNRDTALSLATGNEHIETVEALLKAKADPNIANNDGWIALHKAAVNGNIRIAQALLDAGANPNTSTKIGQSPLLFALANRNSETAQALLNAGADPNLTTQNGDSALNYAAENGNIEIVQALLDANANPNITDKNGHPALHSALVKGKIEIVQVLLQAGANPNTIDKKGDTILNKAIRRGDIDIAIQLINAGADCNKKYGFFDKPFSLAKKLKSERKEELIKALVENGANTTNYKKTNLLVSLVIVSCIAFPAALASTLLLPKLFLILAPIAGLIAITSIVIGTLYSKEPDNLYVNIATNKSIKATSIVTDGKQKNTQQVNEVDNTNEKTMTLEK